LSIARRHATSATASRGRRIIVRRHRRIRTSGGIAGTLLAMACAIAALCAAPAAADSLTYIRGHNVWLANPDGSGQYQVTFDGTAGAPYESPSQANDGTIVAIRETPGQRRQLYRMTQSGRLLNAPINTPAPGTGAMNSKVSPNGALVAYWFVTTVSDPLCTFCVNLSNRALLSHSSRFTGPDEVGTPNTGGWPSWIGDDTIVVGSGSATQWYFKLGMSEAAEWFADTDFVTQNFQTLLDAEAAPTGDRLAVVRGNHQETILLLRMGGPPPVKPTVADPQCAVLSQPTGKFVDPTWSSDGRLLAWQEDDGVWSGAIPADLASCAGMGPFALRIAGATQPDLSPAAINPGPRPPCGNPGNPTACDVERVCPACEGDQREREQGKPVLDPAALRRAIGGFARSATRGLARLGIRGLQRKRRLTIAFSAPTAGTLTARLSASGASARGATVLASGRHVYASDGKAKLTLKLTRKGAKALRRVRRLRATLKVSFTPSGSRAISTTSNFRLKR
jgi:hypothetical protein